MREDFEIEKTNSSETIISHPWIWRTVIISSIILVPLILLSPPLATALVAAIVIAIIISRNLLVGLIVFLAIALLFLFPVPETVRRLHLTLSLAMVTLFGLLMRMMTSREFELTKSSQNYFILGFVMMASFAGLPYIKGNYLGFLEVWKVATLYFLVANLVKKRSHIVVMSWALIILATVLSLTSMILYMGGTRMWQSERMLRVGGADPNDFSMFLLMVLPLSLSLLENSRSKLVKGFLVTIFATLILSAFFTRSRGGSIGLAIVLLILISGGFFQKPRKWALPISTILIILILLPFIPSEYWERMKTLTDFSDPSIRARLEAWRLGLYMISQHPFLGVGLGNFSKNVTRLAPLTPGIRVIRSGVAHNAYISIAAETGIITLFFFLLIIISAFRSLRKNQGLFQERGDFLLSSLCRSLLIGLIGYTVSTMFLSQELSRSAWILFGLAAAMEDIQAKHTLSPINKEGYLNLEKKQSR